MKIAIASTLSFYKKTLPVLIPSLLECGYNVNDIAVFVGSCSTNYVECISGINHYFVDNNTFELTALVGIVEQNLEADYWFLIHDTCRVGKEFKKKIENIPAHAPDKIAIRTCPSMSMGAYKNSYLQSIKQEILNLKNTDYSAESLQHCKQWHIENEDCILWKKDPIPHIYEGFSDNNIQITASEDCYNSTTTRRTEYYPHIDLYKNKSNWGQTPTNSAIITI
jgi:hypothetical protein